jgi:uncharacterized membrane protein (UPF0136 family)
MLFPVSTFTISSSIGPVCRQDHLLTLLGYLLKENKDWGSELALGNSIVLLGAAVMRIVKTRGKAPVPLGLGLVGSLATFYYQKKYREFTFGV